MINKSCSSVNWTVHLLFQQMHSSADMSTFSKLVWQRLTLLCPFPDKKDSFCQTVQSLSLSQADILQLLILRMVDRVKFKVPFSTCRGPNPDTLVYLSLCVVSAHRASNLCPFQDRSLSDPNICIYPWTMTMKMTMTNAFYYRRHNRKTAVTKHNRYMDVYNCWNSRSTLQWISQQPLII